MVSLFILNAISHSIAYHQKPCLQHALNFRCTRGLSSRDVQLDRPSIITHAKLSWHHFFFHNKHRCRAFMTTPRSISVQQLHMNVRPRCDERRRAPSVATGTTIKCFFLRDDSFLIAKKDTAFTSSNSL